MAFSRNCQHSKHDAGFFVVIAVSGGLVYVTLGGPYMNGRSNPPFRRLKLPIVLTVVLLALPFPTGSASARQQAHDHTIALPPGVPQAIETMYDGDPDAAITTFRVLQKSDPENPLGFLLEAEARWWKIYCEACEVKWGMVDAWKRNPVSGDDEYLALTGRGIEVARTQFAAHDSAEMHLYAGIGLALQARLYALRYEKRATAKAGVAARQEFLRALQMDPGLADADTGLGLYNYYVDTLSSFVKMLRFMMGIPGGSREEGIRQLERGMKDGQLTAVEARFYLAKNLRTYDHDYPRALEIAEPLVARYRRNPIFWMLIGNLQAELGRKEKAAAAFREAENLHPPDSECEKRIHEMARRGWSSVANPPQ
jgi:tetratricopeptide (TPR) repeat protein